MALAPTGLEAMAVINFLLLHNVSLSSRLTGITKACLIIISTKHSTQNYKEGVGVNAQASNSSNCLSNTLHLRWEDTAIPRLIVVPDIRQNEETRLTPGRNCINSVNTYFIIKWGCVWSFFFFFFLQRVEPPQRQWVKKWPLWKTMLKNEFFQHIAAAQF